VWQDVCVFVQVVSLFFASFVIGHCAVNKCELNWSCSVGSQKSSW